MRILWFNGGLLPDACHQLGFPDSVNAGWIPSQLAALREIDSSLQFCVLCLDHRPCDVTVDNVRYISFGKKRQYSYKVIPKEIENEVKEYIREFDPDIIHIHGTEYFFSRFSESVYCEKPVVISIQGLISGCCIHYNGGLSPKEMWPFEWNLRRLIWRTTMQREQSFWRDVRMPSEEVTIKCHRYFMGRTDWDRSWIKLYNPSAEYYHVNETLRDPFYEGPRDENNIEKYTIYSSASAGYPLKGGHWLLMAIFHLKEKYPGIRLRIAAARPRLSENKTLHERLRDDYYATYLRNLIKKLGISQNVELLPALSAIEVAQVLKKSHLFCLPSLIENSPNSLGEAMMLGVPSIATYVGGVPSILKNGEEGVLCPSSDVASLVSSIEWCFEHSDVCSGFADRAYTTSLQRHDKKRNASRTLEVYRSIVQQHELGILRV